MRVDSGKFFYDKAKWALRITLWPRKCAVSGEILFLEPAWRGVVRWTTTDEILPEVRWLSQVEYALLQQKKRKKHD